MLNNRDIAIIGMSGEFPDAVNINELWQNLIKGHNSIVELPKDRWLSLSQDEQRAAFFKDVYCHFGGFVSEPYHFDPSFFGIAPIAAKKMDPQERRLLHTTYYALEDSGFFSSPINNVGVYVSAMFGHYTDLDSSSLCSSSFASIANRVSYCFDFSGPSLSVDTMCSGSLTALHLAINGLRNNECDQAIVGSSNIMVHPSKYRILCEGGFLSHKGQCFSFGIDADGYVPSEGTVALILKRYVDAVKDKDSIYCVIKGSAINSVAHSSNSYNVPSISSQIAVIKKAIEDAQVDYNDISYIEAHGTGTPVGDPIEIESLRQTYGISVGDSCFIGSIKSNIGHLEGCAGLASIVKVALQLSNRKIVASLFCSPPNPTLNLEGSKLKLVSHLTEWQSDSKPLMAAINSFGAGGSNCHVLLQEDTSIKKDDLPCCSSYIFPISAKTKEALQRRIDDLLEWLKQNRDCSLYALGCTLACSRQHHKYRQCIISDSIESLIRQLIDINSDVNTSFVNGKQIKHELKDKYMQGETVNWNAYYSVKQFCKIPNYPLKGKVYWGLSLPLFDRVQIGYQQKTTNLNQGLEKFTFEVNNISIDWIRSTNKVGKHLLLLPATNTNYKVWNQQIRFFEQLGYTVHIPHYPGHNNNKMFEGDFLLDEVSFVLKEYINTYIKVPFVCIGWSLGGCFAQQLALAMPTQLKALIISGTFSKFNKSILSGITALQQEGKNNGELMDVIFKEGKNFLKVAGAKVTQEAISKYYVAMSKFDTSNQLIRLSMPTLLVVGKDDNIVNADDLTNFDSIKNLTRKVFPNAGHLLPLTHAKLFNEACLAFLIRNGI